MRSRRRPPRTKTWKHMDHASFGLRKRKDCKKSWLTIICTCRHNAQDQQHMKKARSDQIVINIQFRSIILASQNTAQLPCRAATPMRGGRPAGRCGCRY
ncbi:hypothetical protein Y032_0036g3314 [Ancylostoma ceylanicum]|uniref:Uncharacterized protein n=1 Tax=Ancylostoma ceylanicum TaxID=53326 RepID=A0A016UKI7_9BILA|nr:hypothetical protein Y032_0036g3314 [Ancylostoma ceylanicum]